MKNLIRSSSREIAGEELLVDFIDSGKVVDVGQQDSHLDDVVIGAVSGLQDMSYNTRFGYGNNANG